MTTVLAVEGIRASIGKIAVLQGVNLRLDQGETVALLGRNGVGKTSTLRAILGLLKRTAGKVSYLGEDLANVPAHQLAAKGIGYVPQGRGLFPRLTVEENLYLGLKTKPASAIRDEIFQRFPRLKERLSQAARTLSGGEQQLLALSRCLIMKPELILLDEPTEGIMPKLVSQIRQEIADIARRGISVLLVEQNLRTALRLANRIYLMERGNIVHEATPQELKTSPDIVHRYLGVSLQT
jgi:branched-chain amino acid transport system ATP-binding protein